MWSKSFLLSTRLMSAFCHPVLEWRGFLLCPPTPQPGRISCHTSCPVVCLRSPLWIWYEATSAQWSARQPMMSCGMMLYGPSDVLLALVREHNGELSLAPDIKWHDEIVSVGFCVLISYDAQSDDRNEELKENSKLRMLRAPPTAHSW